MQEGATTEMKISIMSSIVSTVGLCRQNPSPSTANAPPLIFLSIKKSLIHSTWVNTDSLMSTKKKTLERIWNLVAIGKRPRESASRKNADVKRRKPAKMKEEKRSVTKNVMSVVKQTKEISVIEMTVGISVTEMTAEISVTETIVVRMTAEVMTAVETIVVVMTAVEMIVVVMTDMVMTVVETIVVRMIAEVMIAIAAKMTVEISVTEMIVAVMTDMVMTVVETIAVRLTAAVMIVIAAKMTGETPVKTNAEPIVDKTNAVVMTAEISVTEMIVAVMTDMVMTVVETIAVRLTAAVMIVIAVKMTGETPAKMNAELRDVKTNAGMSAEAIEELHVVMMIITVPAMLQSTKRLATSLLSKDLSKESLAGKKKVLSKGSSKKVEERVLFQKKLGRKLKKSSVK